MKTRQSQRIDSYQGKRVSNESKNLPGHEERIKQHEDRIMKESESTFTKLRKARERCGYIKIDRHTDASDISVVKALHKAIGRESKQDG